MIDVRRDDGAAARDLGTDEFRWQSLARRDEFHLGGDFAASCVVALCSDVTSRAPRRDPRLAQLGQPDADIMSLRTARVVKPDRRFAAAQCHFAYRHAKRDLRTCWCDLRGPLVVRLPGIRICRGEINHETCRRDP
jgi:hypothetical protein